MSTLEKDSIEAPGEDIAIKRNQSANNCGQNKPNNIYSKASQGILKTKLHSQRNAVQIKVPSDPKLFIKNAYKNDLNVNFFKESPLKHSNTITSENYNYLQNQDDLAPSAYKKDLKHAETEIQTPRNNSKNSMFYLKQNLQPNLCIVTHPKYYTGQPKKRFSQQQHQSLEKNKSHGRTNSVTFKSDDRDLGLHVRHPTLGDRQKNKKEDLKLDFDDILRFTMPNSTNSMDTANFKKMLNNKSAGISRFNKSARYHSDSVKVLPNQLLNDLNPDMVKRIKANYITTKSTNDYYGTKETEYNEMDSPSLKKAIFEDKYDYEKKLGIWKDKLEINHQIYRDSILQGNWYYKKIQDSLRSSVEISDHGRINSKMNPLRKLTSEMFAVKPDIQNVLDKTKDNLQNFLSRDIIKKPNYFQDIMNDYTALVKTIAIRFQKCGFFYLSQSLECLWAFLAYACDQLSKNFDSVLSDKYEEIRQELSNQLNLQKRDKEVSDMKYEADMTWYKRELQDYKTRLTEQEKLASELQKENNVLSAKLESGRVEPGTIMSKCSKLQQDMHQMIEGLESVKFENTRQLSQVSRDFSWLLRTCKKVNFNMQDQSTQTDLKMSETTIMSNYLDMVDYSYDIKTVVLANENPQYKFLPKIIYKSDDSETFVNEKLLPETRKMICSYLESDSENNLNYVIIDYLMQNFGYYITKQLLESIYYSYHNTKLLEIDPKLALLGKFQCMDQQNNFKPVRNKVCPIKQTEFGIIKKIFYAIMDENKYSIKDYAKSTDQVTINFDYILNRLLKKNRVFNEDNLFRRYLKQILRRTLVNNILIERYDENLNFDDGNNLIKFYIEKFPENNRTYKIIYQALKKLSFHEEFPGCCYIPIESKMKALEDAFEMKSPKIYELLGEYEKALVNKCDDIILGNFYYYEFIYQMLKPILNKNFELLYNIDVEMVLVCAFQALDMQNQEFWISNKNMIIEIIKEGKFEILKSLLNFTEVEKENESDGNMGVILSALSKLIRKDEHTSSDELQDDEHQHDFKKEVIEKSESKSKLLLDGEKSGSIPNLNINISENLKEVFFGGKLVPEDILKKSRINNSKLLQKAFTTIQKLYPVIFDSRNPYAKDILLSKNMARTNLKKNQIGESGKQIKQGEKTKIKPLQKSKMNNGKDKKLSVVDPLSNAKQSRRGSMSNLSQA